MKSASRPVLLIDVDGVLNIYGVERCPDGYSEFNLLPDDDEPESSVMSRTQKAPSCSTTRRGNTRPLHRAR